MEEICLIARNVLVCAHILAGAAWFGAMLYSLVVVHPRAKSFFRNSAEFEGFIATLAAGGRWKVLGGCIFIALTGGTLLLLREPEQQSITFRSCLIAKICLFTAAVGLFCFTSWILWPARVMASGDEIRKFQQRFRIIAAALLALVGFCMTLGILGSHS